MIHVTCRLTAKNRDQLQNPTLDNRVLATFTFLIYNDSDRALHDISPRADSTMMSPLLCDTAYLSVICLELLCDLFLPIAQLQAVEEHNTLVTRLVRYSW